MYESSEPIKDEKHLVILVHGIRTHANHFSELKKLLIEEGFTVEFTNYGRFDLVRFLTPIDFFGEIAADNVWHQIEEAIYIQGQPQHISVIAHSFGTYIVGRILPKKPNFRASKIILCGSVLPYNFDFSNFRTKFEGKILNEIGTKDFWPAIAANVTWGYGSAGTFGFKVPSVEDRWHNDLSHSDFNSAEFCSKYWIPYLRNGSITDGSVPHKKQPWYVSLLGSLKPRWLFVVALVYLISLLWSTFETGQRTSVLETRTVKTSCSPIDVIGCTSFESQTYSFTPNYFIRKEKTYVSIGKASGTGRGGCELSFTDQVETTSADDAELYRSLTVEARTESGAGEKKMGIIFTTTCDVEIFLVGN